MELPATSPTSTASASSAESVSTPCTQCPWRLSNQGKKSKWGFYTKKNILRLWNEIRGGGGIQSCHMTDPCHEDHLAAGCKAGAKTRECAGSVIVILRELDLLKRPDRQPIEPEDADRYLATRKKGFTKMGLLYYLISRMSMGGVPFLGGPKLPSVNVDDEEIGLPNYLRES